MAAYVMSMTLTEITAHICETTSSFLPLMGSLELSGVGSGSSNQASSLSVFVSCDWFFHDTVFLACFPVRCMEVSPCESKVEMVPARRGEKEYEAEDLGDRKISVAGGSSRTFLHDELLYKILLRFLRVG